MSVPSIEGGGADFQFSGAGTAALLTPQLDTFAVGQLEHPRVDFPPELKKVISNAAFDDHGVTWAVGEVIPPSDVNPNAAAGILKHKLVFVGYPTDLPAQVYAVAAGYVSDRRKRTLYVVAGFGGRACSPDRDCQNNN